MIQHERAVRFGFPHRRAAAARRRCSASSGPGGTRTPRRRRRVRDARPSARARVPRASAVTRGTTELVLRLCATLSVLRPLPDTRRFEGPEGSSARNESCCLCRRVSQAQLSSLIKLELTCNNWHINCRPRQRLTVTTKEIDDSHCSDLGRRRPLRALVRESNGPHRAPPRRPRGPGPLPATDLPCLPTPLRRRRHLPPRQGPRPSPEPRLASRASAMRPHANRHWMCLAALTTAAETGRILLCVVPSRWNKNTNNKLTNHPN